MITCTGDPSEEETMAGWEPATNVERKDGATGTTYKLHHDGQELRVRVRTDRDQVEFWAAGPGWVVTSVRTNEHGCGVNMVPR